MSLTLEKKLPNDAWENLELIVGDDMIELRSPDVGYVQLTHEEFDEISRLVSQYREAAKITNTQIK